MKVSSLNKFKGKEVVVTYTDLQNFVTNITGTLDDVEEEQISIDYKNGIQNISIENIMNIELVQ